jgi:hypothetical protein
VQIITVIILITPPHLILLKALPYITVYYNNGYFEDWAFGVQRPRDLLVGVKATFICTNEALTLNHPCIRFGEGFRAETWFLGTAQVPGKSPSLEASSEQGLELL